MNLRQKNKKLKQELEWYKKQMVPTREVRFDSRQMRVETLCANIVYSDLDIRYFRDIGVDNLDEIIKDNIIKKLASCLDDYIKYDIMLHRDEGLYEVIGKLKVVVPDGGDGF